MNERETEEIWLPVAGYEGLYEVSNRGRLRSLDRYTRGRGGCLRKRKGKLFQPNANSRGYHVTTLSDAEGVRTTLSVHRLVAEAFIPKEEGKDVINHIDGNKMNNAAENLEWSTIRENTLHAIELGLAFPPVGGDGLHPGSKLTAEDVRNIRDLLEEGRTPVRQIAAYFDVTPDHIYKIKNGQTHVRV